MKSLIKLHQRMEGQRRNGSLISLSRWNESTTIYSSTFVPCHKTVWLQRNKHFPVSRAQSQNNSPSSSSSSSSSSQEGITRARNGFGGREQYQSLRHLPARYPYMSYRHTYIKFYLLIILGSYKYSNLACTKFIQFNILVVTLANSEVLFLRRDLSNERNTSKAIREQS